ncbi:MAG: lipopolysaccharide assembly protein LapB [Gammaproteobacteria bacterium]|nr:lipopolysaccharide assembly protein LapB [Gammaproteobacteria bacterium]MCH9744211.1 lipopolysaccharide assembly protein LapB [Gammaproteobacteria bacterium]
MLAQLSVLLLPVAAVSGWFVARRDRSQKGHQDNIKIRRDYFKGLNYLINEQPDKAVDVFIQLLKVDADTVETHLTLGSLFRRRGEVDRAIRVHQNLIARPQLSVVHRTQALSALGQDYLHAGVLDRAERLFIELVNMGANNEPSLRFLLRIYEKEKDWEKAVEIARKLESTTKKSMKPTIAHYYCELAEIMIEQKRFSDAHGYLKRARSIDAKCVRASLLQGKLAMALGEYREAIRCYSRVKQQNPDYLTEIVSPLATCYRKCDDDQGYIDFLQECIVDYPRYAVILALAEHYKQKYGNENAAEFVAKQVQRQPTFRGLSYLTSLYLSGSSDSSSECLRMILNLMHKLMADKPLYQCGQCGFSSKALFWLCPSCHQWNCIRSIQGLEGV